MAKLKLELEYEFDFLLLGISCHLPNYRLAWLLNQILNIDLHRKDDLDLTFKKRNKGYFSYYHFNDENFTTINLISNRSQEGYFVQEYKQLDYFMQLWLPEEESFNDIQQTLKKSENILAILPVDVENLKSKSNFLF